MIDGEKLHPAEIMQELERLRKRDMDGYLEPSTGTLREDLSVAVDACPACKSQRRQFAFRKEAFSYQSCENCGSVYVERRLNAAMMETLYGPDGRSVYQMKHLYIPTADYRIETIYKRKAEALRSLTAGRRLLDFGCSAGYFMAAARNAGWDVDGVELNEFSANWAKQELGLEAVFHGDIREAGYAPQSFDIITMWDVFEHVPDPAALLELVKPYLKADGTIVIETSHIDCFETEFLNADNTNIVGDLHLIHFTLDALKKIATSRGFDVKNYEIFGLDLAHIMSFLRMKNQSKFEIPSSLVNAIQQLIDETDKGCYIRVELSISNVNQKTTK